MCNKPPQLIFSQFYRSLGTETSVPKSLGVLCPNFTGLKSVCEPGLGSVVGQLRPGVLFQAHPCCWQNLFPCSCKTEIPHFLHDSQSGFSQPLQASSIPYHMAPTFKPSMSCLLLLKGPLTSSSASKGPT